MVYTCTVKAEQFQATKHRGRQPSATGRLPTATAKTKQSFNFPILNIFVSKKRRKIISTYKCIIIQHTHLKIKEETDIEKKKEKRERERKRERTKKKERERKKQEMREIERERKRYIE